MVQIHIFSSVLKFNENYEYIDLRPRGVLDGRNNYLGPVNDLGVEYGAQSRFRISMMSFL